MKIATIFTEKAFFFSPHNTDSSVRSKNDYGTHGTLERSVQVRETLQIQQMHLKTSGILRVHLKIITSSMKRTPGISSAMPWSMYSFTTLLISVRRRSGDVKLSKSERSYRWHYFWNMVSPTTLIFCHLNTDNSFRKVFRIMSKGISLRSYQWFQSSWAWGVDQRWKTHLPSALEDAHSPRPNRAESRPAVILSLHKIKWSKFSSFFTFKLNWEVFFQYPRNTQTWTTSLVLWTSPLGRGTNSSASRSNSDAYASQRPTLWKFRSYSLVFEL